MKKRNLLLVILAILLVFGLVMGCGPAEEEEEKPPAGPDLSKPETYFGSYQATYTTSGGKTIHETIVFDDTYFTIWDDDTDATGKANNDYLRFAITDDWTTDTTPATYIGDYPNAFKFEGRITAGKPVTASGTAGAIFGSQTAPGFSKTDIDSSTPAYMKMYFKYTDSGITFIRTRFNKKANTAPDESVVKHSSADGSPLRTFVKIADATIPSYIQQ